jgi:uncharacterized protein with ACT and thioredoxin-like domain
MKRTFEGWLFNRMEQLGGETFNHVGCEGDNELFIDFLTQFVPEVGTRRKVYFTVESKDETETIEDYKITKDYVKGVKND